MGVHEIFHILRKEGVVKVPQDLLMLGKEDLVKLENVDEKAAEKFLKWVKELYG